MMPSPFRFSLAVPLLCLLAALPGLCTAAEQALPPAGCLLTAAVDSLSPVTCAGLSDGAIFVSVGGATGTYSFLWSHGATVEDPTGLPGGLYAATVTDAVGCSAILGPLLLDEPQPLEVGVDTVGHAACAGDSSGFLAVTVTGGVPPYSFFWSNGATEEDLAELPAGNYLAVLSDARGCPSFVGPVDIGEPAPIVWSVANIGDIACSGDSSGVVQLSVTGGTGPLSIAWNTGATANALIGLPAGNYWATLTDGTGCSLSTDTIALGEPPAVTWAPLLSDISCHGLADGALDPSPTGGTPPYAFQWDNGATTPSLSGLSTGIYALTLYDANGCSATAPTWSIDEPAPLLLTAAQTPASGPGATDGALDLSVTGGTPGYGFAWNNGSTDEDLSAVTSGTYIVTVTDANGCSAVLADSITAEPAVGFTGGSEGWLPRLFPNPTHGSLWIELPLVEGKKVTMVLSDALGRTVFCTELVGEAGQPRRLDLGALPPGTYTVCLAGGGFFSTSKIIRK